MKLLSLSCLLVVVVILVQVLLEPAALAQCQSPMDPCVNTLDCGGCDADHGGNIPDPGSCLGYYVCLNNTELLPFPELCPEGQIFDPTTLECNETAECFTCPQECVFDCSDPSTPPSVSSLSDCNEYYQCADGVAGDPIHCPDETPFYDGEECQTEETRCCRCQPSCDGDHVYVIDPLDCRNFWQCLDTYPPTITGTCPRLEVFNASLEECSYSSTCVTACPNVVNTDGCIDPFICLQTGFFAKCTNQCVQEYYDCSEETWPEYQEPESCSEGTVFHPDNHVCVDPGDCPY